GGARGAAGDDPGPGEGSRQGRQAGAPQGEDVGQGSVGVALLLSLALLLLLPDPAWAWGPATHVYLGTGVLDSLSLLPPAVRSVVAACPYAFLYGSVAADISLAKKYVPEGRHCHNWHVGEEIYQTADTDRLRAVGLGYLAHLAADTIAHNVFVPRQLLLTSSSKAPGHSYRSE